VKPLLVGEIAFTEWTDEGTLRHPSFQGLREDKPASEVVRERPIAAPMESDSPRPARSTRSSQSGSDSNSGSGKSSRKRKIESDPERRTKPGPAPQRKGISAGKARGAAGDENVIAGITLSNPDKVLYPEAGVTKRELALFYEAIADSIVPEVRNRPLTLVRCPNGWQKQCFYQKHVKDGVPEVIDRVSVPEGSGKAVYMMANSLSAVVALVQMGVLELHPWGSSAEKLRSPDRIIFDFDPDDDLPWSAVVDAVRAVRSLMEEIGLPAFLKTTGGKGLHVVVPIKPVQPWAVVKGFTKAVAELFANTFPDRFTSTLSKKSRHGKIFIDYLRNAEGATAIAAYSARARANAPVATPIAWEELRQDVRFDHFNVRNVPERVKRAKKDPWADMSRASRPVTAAMMKRVGFSGK
jgi:bifunctional non-homologous end joining protein LigD